MNKEELEKEAERYWIDQPPFTEIRDRVIQAYIDSAEPREKRIAELEQKLEQIKNERFEKALSQIKHDREVVIEYNERLKKENAELKEKLGDVQMQKAGEKSDLVWKLKTANEQKTEQLTKAIELLKQWLQTYKASGCDNINIVTDTEQFLEEIKEK